MSTEADTSRAVGSGSIGGVAADPEGLDPSRVPRAIVGLRRHAARGSLITSGFNVGIYGLTTAERILVAAWLTRSQYGFWGVLVAALIGLTWIKQVGVADKYIQQSEPDQELAFQKAFTMELCLSLAFVAVVAIALPLYALAYSRLQLIVPGLVLSVIVPLTAFESPAWIPYRRLEYGRARVLASIDPVCTVAITISLAAAGLGYWGLIIGALSGSLVGASVCVLTSPIPLRLRIDRPTVKAYASFGWPLVGFGLCQLISVQGVVLAANRVVGLAGIGAIGLSGNLTSMADGVDGIVSQVIYPVVCAVADRKQLLREAFVKSNRVALMWGMPTMVGLALFAGDLVHFILGHRWEPAVPLFAAVALSCGLTQVAFNWAIFLRAVNRTRPIFVVAIVQVAVTLLVTVPAIVVFGVIGYGIGVAAVSVAQVALRGYFMRRVLGGFSAARQLARAVAPTVPAVAVIGAIRLAAGAPHSIAVAIGEVAIYSVTVICATYVFEKALIREMIGYLTGRGARPSFALAANDAPVR